jgi:hypothetical protein
LALVCFRLVGSAAAPIVASGHNSKALACKEGFENGGANGSKHCGCLLFVAMEKGTRRIAPEQYRRRQQAVGLGDCSWSVHGGDATQDWQSYFQTCYVIWRGKK